MSTREQQLNATFVALADTLVSDFDVNDLLYRLAGACVDVLACDEAGIMIADASEVLRVVGSSSEQLRLLELFEVQNQEGPCLDAYRRGEVVRDADLTVPGDWPRFRERAVRDGYRAVDAVPMRLRDSTIGALNILHYAPGGLSDVDLTTAQALADVATIGLIQQRTVHESQEIAGHLRRALDGQVAVEQAKGMVAERSGQTVGDSFELMRTFARNHNRRLVDVAAAVLSGDLDLPTLRAG
jgi:GAF domain-containing protein